MTDDEQKLLAQMAAQIASGFIAARLPSHSTSVVVVCDSVDLAKQLLTEIGVEAQKPLPLYTDDIDKITAALGLPATASGAEIALAVRSCARRCEELEHKVIALQDSHKP